MVTIVPAPALAQPPAPNPPTTASEALKQYQELDKQAEEVNESLLKAQTDLDARNLELGKANEDLAAAETLQNQASQDEEQFRGQIDDLAGASFQGARFNKLSALLTGASAQDFLDRASALNILASENAQALDVYTGAVEKASQGKTNAADAKRRAEEAKGAAEKLTADIKIQQNELEGKKKTVKEALEKLSGKDKEDLFGDDDNTVYIGPPGAAGTAMNVALQQRGDPYVWGADGPNSFDCSGLVMFAYKAAGVSLPHSSRAQYGFGKSVAYGQWKPGDLIFYGSSVSTIHHVVMYIGNGRVVHASHSGTPVKTDTVESASSDYVGAKRIVG